MPHDVLGLNPQAVDVEHDGQSVRERFLLVPAVELDNVPDEEIEDLAGVHHLVVGLHEFEATVDVLAHGGVGEDLFLDLGVELERDESE